MVRFVSPSKLQNIDVSLLVWQGSVWVRIHSFGYPSELAPGHEAIKHLRCLRGRNKDTPDSPISDEFGDSAELVWPCVEQVCRSPTRCKEHGHTLPVVKSHEDNELVSVLLQPWSPGSRGMEDMGTEMRLHLVDHAPGEVCRPRERPDSGASHMDSWISRDGILEFGYGVLAYPVGPRRSSNQVHSLAPGVRHRVTGLSVPCESAISCRLFEWRTAAIASETKAQAVGSSLEYPPPSFASGTRRIRRRIPLLDHAEAPIGTSTDETKA